MMKLRCRRAVVDQRQRAVGAAQEEGVVGAFEDQLHRQWRGLASGRAFRPRGSTIWRWSSLGRYRTATWPIRCTSAAPAALDELADHGVAGFAVLGADFTLISSWCSSAASISATQRIGHALAADLQHRLQVVRLAAQEAGLGGGQGGGHALRTGLGRGRAGYHGGPQRPDFRALRSPHPSMATRSKSSQRWLKEHFSDPYVKKAQAEGLRSRAAYKLEELVERDRLLKPGMVVVDLGAAPGGWSQWVRQALGDSGRVIALDILEMPTLAGVEFLHGDFREDAVLSQLEADAGRASRSTLCCPTWPPIRVVWMRSTSRGRCIWRNWRWISPTATCSPAARS